MRRVFDRIALLVTSALIMACGGGGDTAPATTAPPPPPPPALTAATITISAGDGQQAEPNALLATPPSVVVRSSNGTAVPNITVTFAVDSGGGSISTPIATTDANGIASAASWRMGASEGPQVLTATVASLPALRIRATVRIEPKVVGTGTVTSAGGTVTISQSGSPLNGLTITVPAGATSTNAAISLSIASSSGIALRPGIVATSAQLLLTSSAGRLKKPATIRFPVASKPSPATFIGVRNPRTGDVNILSPLGSDGSSVSALLWAMDAAQVAGVPGGSLGALRTGSIREDDPVGLFTLTIGDPAILSNPYDSKFRARRDNWDFEAMPIAWLPFLPGTAGVRAEEEELDPSAGMIATALWYFENRKGDVPLYNRFRLQPDQAYSNKMGLRWSAMANLELRDVAAQLSRTWNEWVSKDAAVFAKTQLDALKVLFYVERERPVPVLLYDDIANSDTKESIGIGIATRVTGDEVSIVVADNPEAEYTIKLSPTGWQPFTIIKNNGSAFIVRGFSPLLSRTLTDGPAVGSNWGRVLAGTLGDAEGWPSPTLHWAKGELDTTAVFLSDTLRFWWQCASCPDFGLRDSRLPTASHLQGFLFGRKVGGAMAPFGTILRVEARWRDDSVSSDVDPTVTGHAVFLPQLPSGASSNQVLPGWLDWKTVNFKRTSLRPSPSALEIGQDTTATFTLSPTVALPPGTRFSWVLRTSDGRDSVEAAPGAHTRNLKLDKPGMLLITAHEAGTKRAIARDSVEIKAVESAPFWQVTSIRDQDHLFDDVDIGTSGPIADVFVRLLEAPRSGAITIEQGSGGLTELRLRVRKSSLWDPAACCPLPPFSASAEFLQQFGFAPAVQIPLGPFFSPWGNNAWSQTTTNLGAGTLTGQFIPGTQTYRIRNQGSQVGPTGGLRITATRSGLQMTGTITITIWWVDDESGMIESAPETFRFPFAATRMR